MLVKFTPAGIYCEKAGIYIDPWKPVDRAVITHAHSDHARQGSRHYLCHVDSSSILQYRLGEISADTLRYNEKIQINGVELSLHPAGHITGSAQVRLSYKGETWVISGDYKTANDGYTEPFEPVKCQHFVTESTFGLPVYNFPSTAALTVSVNEWVAQNAEQGFNSVILGYALGKSQRILKTLATHLPVLLHTAVYNTNEALGFSNAGYIKFTPEFKKADLYPGIVVAPSSALGSAWLTRFEPYRLAICSGWMQLRGARRRSNADKGFAMSDHADWEGLNEAVLATGARHVYVTHGYQDIFARWLREKYGLNAVSVETKFEGESIQGLTDSNAAQPEDTP
jgi:putative mRNA 3-end processing factor